MTLSSRHPETLADPAARAGPNAHAASIPEAAASDVFLLSDALQEAGDLSGKIVLDITDSFGPGGVLPRPAGLTSTAAYNQSRAHGTSLVKACTAPTLFVAMAPVLWGLRLSRPGARLALVRLPTP